MRRPPRNGFESAEPVSLGHEAVVLQLKNNCRPSSRALANLLSQVQSRVRSSSTPSSNSSNVLAFPQLMLLP